MRRKLYFDRFDSNGWPALSELEPFFLAPKGQEWSFQGRNDSWGMEVQGLYGTGDRAEMDRVDVDLYMTGNRDLGVYFVYSKWDGRIRHKYSYSPKGDLSRLGEFVESLHGDSLSVGLFVPFPAAWKAVKEFMETDGELPTSIEWIATRDFPPGTFPVPKPPSMLQRPRPPWLWGLSSLATSTRNTTELSAAHGVPGTTALQVPSARPIVNLW